jgi:hypothetical protein
MSITSRQNLGRCVPTQIRYFQNIQFSVYIATKNSWSSVREYLKMTESDFGLTRESSFNRLFQSGLARGSCRSRSNWASERFSSDNRSLRAMWSEISFAVPREACLEWGAFQSGCRSWFRESILRRLTDLKKALISNTLLNSENYGQSWENDCIIGILDDSR